MNLSKFYIDGDWVDPIEPNSIPVINPASEESIGNVILVQKRMLIKQYKLHEMLFKVFQKQFQKELSY